MSRHRFFCAARSRLNNECIYGTVARIDSWLLVEYCGVWRRCAIERSAIAEEIRGQLLRTGDKAIATRPLLIRQSYRQTTSIRCFFVRSSESGSRIMRVDLSEYRDLTSVNLFDLENNPRARQLDGATYAVCTHGTHDKCCSKYGLPVYRALREQAGEDVWQCSHVGGDRFAANVVVFPYGIYYGRVTPESVAEIVEKTNRGEISLAHYRGRCCYPRAAQVAEYFLRAESGRTGIEEFRLQSANQSQGGFRIHFEALTDATRHQVQIRRRANQLSDYLTCTSTNPEAVVQYELVRYSADWA